MSFFLVKSPSKTCFFLAMAGGLCVSGAAIAQTLEERVQALEEKQVGGNESLLTLRELVDRVSVSGFISLRGGQIDSEDSIYLNILDDEWSFSDESVVGLQVDASVINDLSVSLQLKYSGQSNDLALEWGYLEYAVQPDLKVRAGRLRVPGYMLSEYLDVGYAYPWAQVPAEVYGWLPFSRYEGLDLRYWMTLGDVDMRLGTYLGTTSDQALNMGNLHYTDQSSQFAGVEVQATYDIYTVRANYARYQFELSNSVSDSALGALVNGVTLVPGIGPYYDEVKIPGLIDYVNHVMVGDGVTPNSGVLTDAILVIQGDGNPGNDFLIPVLQAEGASLQAQLEPYENMSVMAGDTDGQFVGVGFSADNGQFLMMTELTRSRIEGVYPDMEGGYVMVGYRFGNWMPHLTLAKIYTVNDDEFPEFSSIETNAAINAIIPGYEQVAAGMNAYTDILQASSNAFRVEQQSVTLGVRWDPMASLDLKAEVFYVEPQNGSYGFAMPEAIQNLDNNNSTGLQDAAAEFVAPEDSITGIRLALDAVF